MTIHTVQFTKNPRPPTPATTSDKAERWSVAQVEALLQLPFADLIYRAQQVHREHFDANAVQLSALLSIKTGGCPEDCGYCPQAARYDTSVKSQELMGIGEVLEAARVAKAAGATRFCMGAAWRGPKQRDLEPVLEMVRTKSSGSISSLPASGVPSTCTNILMGTLSG